MKSSGPAKAHLGWCVTLLVTLPIFLLLRPEPQSVPQLGKFLGRFHVVLLHLPIGLLLLALLLELSRFPKLNRLLPATPAPVSLFVLGAGAASAYAAAFCGWLLSLSGGYDATLLNRHLYLGLAAAAGGLLAMIFRLAANPSPAPPRLSLAVLAITNGLIIAAGHFGGVLTHGNDYLTEYAPNFVRQMLGQPVKSPEPGGDVLDREVFAGVVRPILEARCTSCHNAEKAKGDLRLDTYAHATADPKHVAPGKPEDSELLKRIHLPLDDDDHMPPEGKPQPTAAEVAILEWWIKAGAPEKKTVRELSPNQPIQVALEQWGKAK